MTAKLNDVDPLAWPHIADIPQGQLSELPPWNWNTRSGAHGAGRVNSA
jgi:hypothetical protein